DCLRSTARQSAHRRAVGSCRANGEWLHVRRWQTTSPRDSRMGSGRGWPSLPFLGRVNRTAVRRGDFVCSGTSPGPKRDLVLAAGGGTPGVTLPVRFVTRRQALLLRRNGT